jgi:DNA replication protein DnaC
MIDRDRRMVERRIKAAKFPAVKSLDSFDFTAIPKLNKMQVLELARCEWIERRENVIALAPAAPAKTHVALGLGLAACQKGCPSASPRPPSAGQRDDGGARRAASAALPEADGGLQAAHHR